jgi:hypothetical protein
MHSPGISRPNRRRAGIVNIAERFAIQYHEALAFVAGLAAYPVGMALLSILGLQ